MKHCFYIFQTTKGELQYVIATGNSDNLYVIAFAAVSADTDKHFHHIRTLLPGGS